MATNLKDLGNKVKSARNNLGISQEELANRVGYKTKGSIARIENGERDLPIDKLKLLAKALNTTPEYLVGWDIEKKEQSITKASRDIEPTIEEIRAKLNESELIELDTLITLNTTMFQKRGDLKDYTKEQVIKALTIAFYDTLPRLNDNK